MHAGDLSNNRDGRNAADSRWVRLHGKMLVVHAYFARPPCPTPLLVFDSPTSAMDCLSR
jgi:hypothetical protein